MANPQVVGYVTSSNIFESYLKKLKTDLVEPGKNLGLRQARPDTCTVRTSDKVRAIGSLYVGQNKI